LCNLSVVPERGLGPRPSKSYSLERSKSRRNEG
jgi:hypothetical protein